MAVRDGFRHLILRRFNDIKINRYEKRITAVACLYDRYGFFCCI